MTLDGVDMLLDVHYWARDRVLEAAAALTPENTDLIRHYRDTYAGRAT